MMRMPVGIDSQTGGRATQGTKPARRGDFVHGAVGDVEDVVASLQPTRSNQRGDTHCAAESDRS